MMGPVLGILRLHGFVAMEPILPEESLTVGTMDQQQPFVPVPHEFLWLGLLTALRTPDHTDA